MAVVDAARIWDPGFRATDSNDDPLSGGYADFFDSGTSDAKTVYSDAALSSSLGTRVYFDSSGAPVASSGSSTKVTVYVDDSPYKVILYDSDDNVIETKDGIAGALDTATFEASSEALPNLPVVSKSADYTVLTTDLGNVLNVDSTSATRTITLPSAVTAGDNWNVIIRHVGSANEVTIATVSSQTISVPLPGGAATSFNLTSYGETIWLVSDGANWSCVAHVLGLKLGSGHHQKPHDLGTITSGTVTPDPENGNKQKLVNNGAFTLAPPSEACFIEIWVTNAASAGTITTSGFTATAGDSLNTTNTNKFRLTISTDDDGNSTLERRALQ